MKKLKQTITTVEKCCQDSRLCLFQVVRKAKWPRKAKGKINCDLGAIKGQRETLRGSEDKLF